MANQDSVMPVQIHNGAIAWLSSGRKVRVPFGSKGSQLAEVVDPRIDSKGRLKVRKWRANSDRWTGVVKVLAHEIQLEPKEGDA